MIGVTEPIRIAAVGDIMLTRSVGARFRSDPAAFRLDEFRSLFTQHDIAIANLEHPVSAHGEPHRRQDPNVTFRADPATLEVLKNLGISVVTIANNHMLDYGATALADTLENLREAGIAFVGAGRDYTEANRPLTLDIRGQQVGIIARTLIYSVSTARARRRRAGVADYRASSIFSQIRELRGACSCVIVALHWGLEYSFYPLRYQQMLARRIVDAGASLVFGHGPHYPQGIERRGAGTIVYSTGNFIFDEPTRFANRGYVYSGTINRQSAKTLDIYPYEINRGVPQLAASGSFRRLKSFVLNLDRLYARKSKRFWQNHSNRYFQYLIGRVVRARSIRFLFVPQLIFYFHIGARNYFAKIVRLSTSRNR